MLLEALIHHSGQSTITGSHYCGNSLPDGLVKNQKLTENILTPTTKAADHDVPVTPDEIVQRGLMTQADYDEVSRKAMSLFEFGQHVALDHGLILVDTKYEFGKGPDGQIYLIDEGYTPDSSRYWIAHSYQERFCIGLEPENIDTRPTSIEKSVFLLNLPHDAPEELVSELAWRYIFLFETITNSRFEIPGTKVKLCRKPLLDDYSSLLKFVLHVSQSMIESLEMFHRLYHVCSNNNIK
ncbi:Phosphoribosylaminoimidazole-succinocarboxamide synthase (SAICAR synthetase) [Datura stramonium]|uniref:phosphoribosylaminoimidazolesuccinocarboxamide synthase n=1 Tax=Datura stramonium TaxID=4076 RepID=A0ABS8UVW6_DATST|nr:Phosphoribosylaminoimidazole-succinocarboxamide synthase (SAICAR synthetase) [Datura stramonium]